ncbi:MAG: hypothetical protein HQ472_03435 [Ignavibacteria bacterium]|nr:hypothetical protein [Ignavibacteria bacterium]
MVFKQICNANILKSTILNVLLGLGFYCFVILSSTLSFAQDAAEYHGTWFNAEYMKELRKSGSVKLAANELRNEKPLFIKIDSTDLEGNVVVAMALDTRVELILRKSLVGKMGMRWVIGTADGPFWLITVDKEAHNYIVLHRLDSIDLPPIVFGKLPSANQDPEFLLQRMLNSSLLAGSYTDSKGGLSVFNTDMTAVLNTKRVRTSIEVDSRLRVYVTLWRENGKSTVYELERKETSMVLKPKIGRKIILYKR